MTANEAPEKIFVHKSQYFGLMANECHMTDNDVEYTRTDAFIEKAAEWILRNGSYYIAFEQGQPCIDKEFVEEFKNAMKKIKASE